MMCHAFPISPIFSDFRNPGVGNQFLASPLLKASKLKAFLSTFLFCYLLAIFSAGAQPAIDAVGAGAPSLVIEVAGRAEYASGSNTNWQRATVGVTLAPGDRLRTLPESRAAVQLSDRSVIRLNERTTLEILPPRHAEKRRFGLPQGSLFFFNREKPADIEFDTPLAAGAIRGTEFLLESAEASPALRLALIDGLVTLQTSDGQITLQRGEELRLEPGHPPQKTALVNVSSAIQWALYYPAVLNPDDLNLNPEQQRALHEVLTRYRSGDLLAALEAWPTNSPGPDAGVQRLHAAIELSVGGVAEAEAMLASLPSDQSDDALRELIATVKGEKVSTNSIPQNSSGFLARTYTLQAVADLPAALAAARQAVALAPEFGFARARLAELEFSFGNRRAALAELDIALRLSPRSAPAHALRGFVLLEQGDVAAAGAAFDRARELDAAFSLAWLGRGLCLMRQRDFIGARTAFQAAAALEPSRALFRDYLGKASSELGDAKAADKEFGLAKRLDPKDPTGWLYSALQSWQENRINEAIRDLERSADLNDQRAIFRSRLLLDEDQSVRSANLAAIYNDDGLAEVSRHTAARAVAEDYANFSGHLFLANSYQSQEDAKRFDLRLETARQSELLVANLLAPPGAGNLSQQLSQQEHLQLFDPRPLGVSTLTEYGSRGDWHQETSVFGTLDGFSYALDTDYESLNGQQPNNGAEVQQYVLTIKQRVTPDDEFYFQVGDFNSNAGDVARHYDPAQAVVGFHVIEREEPTLYAGWHHEWSPGSHTLFLLARLADTLSYTNPQPNVIFLIQSGGVTTGVQSPPLGPPFGLNFNRDFTLYSAELQQIWETPKQTLVVGGRWQSGNVDTHANLNRDFTGVITNQNTGTSLERGDVYGYDSWQVFDWLQLIGGASYDQITFPANTDLPPISGQETTRVQVSPKAGLLWTPWDRGVFRASYTRSLGGLFFDNSVRLEPTQVAGLNQAFRSLIPESVAGLVPGTKFETAGVGFDQSFPSGTWFGAEAEWLTSSGDRMVGVLTNSLFLPIPDSASSTRQTLNFHEEDLSAYVGQLLGNWFAVSAHYRLSEAHLVGQFPDIPNTAAGLAQLEQDNRATLNQVLLAANFNHPSGVFAQWESVWYQQSSSGYNPALPGDDFWQHNIFVGYRFPRRYAEIRLGVLNLANTDYRLNPLNLYPELPRSRTFTASLQLNF